MRKFVPWVILVLAAIGLTWYWWPPGQLVARGVQCTGMDLSPDGSRLALLSDKGPIVVDVQRMTSVHLAQSAPVLPKGNITWDHTGTHLLWDASPQKTIVFEVSGQREITRLNGSLYRVGPDVVPEGRTLLIDQGRGWQVVNESDWSLGQVIAPCCGVWYYAPKDDHVVYRTHADRVKVGSVKTGQVLLDVPTGTLQSVSPDGRWLLTSHRVSDHHAQTEVMDLRDGSLRRLIDGPDLYAARWLDDQRAVVALNYDEKMTVGIVTVPDGHLWQVDVRGSIDKELNPLEATPDGKTVWVVSRYTVSTSFYGTTHYFLYRIDVQSGAISEQRLPDKIRNVVWDVPFGKVFVASADGTVRAFRLK